MSSGARHWILPSLKIMKPKKPIESLILNLRGQKVILDADLAELYDEPTKVFNQAVKRNADRFPEDFMFQLTTQEWINLKSLIATSSLEDPQIEGGAPNWSQIVTASPDDSPMRSQIVTASKRNIRHRPRAFTEHGAIMAATILNSPEAVAMSVFVVRAFMQMREQLAANAAILKRLAEIDKTLLEHDSALRSIWNKLQPLLAPPPDPPRRRIGFHRDNE
jgi:ORF6N domain